MPRVTRAALQSQEAHDDPASIPLLLTPIKGRVPLGETAGNINAEPTTVYASENEMAAVKKGPGKSKKGNARKTNKAKKDKTTASHVEILEDENQSQTSSAAEEASKDLSNGALSPDAEAIALEDERSHTPPSAAVEEVTQQLSPKSATPEPQSEQPLANNTIKSTEIMSQEQPTLVDDGSRTPMKEGNQNGLGISTGSGAEDEDSFVEQIKSRTPAKRISRIEDSVEALDALEEEIEKVGGLIPEATDIHPSLDHKQQAKSPLKAAGVKPNTPTKANQRKTTVNQPNSAKPTVSVGGSVLRPSVKPTAVKKVNPSTNDKNTVTRRSTTNKTSSASQTAPEPAQTTNKKRISSIHKAPFQPTKSTKPPTRATFELPGDTISRKLKEQREERLKREEAEEKTKRSGFKARPVPRKEAPEVKLTAAAKVRLSMAKGEPVSHPTAKHESSKPRISATPRTSASLGATKRQSSLSVAKRGSIAPTAGDLSSVETHNRPVTASNRSRQVSLAGVPRPAPTTEDLAHQKVKGKEVFGRAKVEIKERENSKREKEEAAKKARAEAAERGRIASRAWAEQQRVRKLEAERARKKAGVEGSSG